MLNVTTGASDTPRRCSAERHRLSRLAGAAGGVYTHAGHPSGSGSTISGTSVADTFSAKMRIAWHCAMIASSSDGAKAPENVAERVRYSRVRVFPPVAVETKLKEPEKASDRDAVCVPSERVAALVVVEVRLIADLEGESSVEALPEALRTLCATATVMVDSAAAGTTAEDRERTATRATMMQREAISACDSEGMRTLACYG
jgi:hypothetical protein